MRKPDSVGCSEEQWELFAELCEEQGISLEDEDDWKSWYDFYEAGINARGE